MTSILERRALPALLAACALLFLWRAGNYGMWDPWETHYGEIARQMAGAQRLHQPWWPGSPIDRARGVPTSPSCTSGSWRRRCSSSASSGRTRSPTELVDSWRAEWAARLPNILLSLVTLGAVWWAVARLAGRRAGAFAVVVLATSSQWMLITRQAMTDCRSSRR